MDDSDRAVAEREHHVPDCALLLDDAALSSRLGFEVRITRVRYKPGSSIVVAWETVHTRDPADMQRHGWAGAFSDPAKADKDLRLAERTGTATWRLSGSTAAVAGTVASDRAVARTMARLRGEYPGVFDGAVLLRHNPLRRQVWRVRGSGLGRPAEPWAVLKIGATAVPSHRRDVRALRDAGVPVLVPAAVRGVAVAESVRWWGRSDLARRPRPEEAHLAGAALAALHRVPAHPKVRRQNPEHLIDRHARAVLNLLPSWRASVGALVDDLDARLDSGSTGARLHGDLSADQVLVKAGRIRLIDFDRTCVGPVERDLGAFDATAELHGQAELIAPFLEGYRDSGGTWDTDTLATWRAVSLFGRATEPFRHHTPGWCETAADTLDRARRAIR